MNHVPPLSYQLAPSKTFEVTRIGDAKRTGADAVVTEEPLEIRLGGGPIAKRQSVRVAVTMRTPGEDGDLAVGFLYSESLVNDFAAIRSHGHCDDVGDDERGNAYRVELRADLPMPDLPLRHSFVSSSCGVCGKRSIAEVRAMVDGKSDREDVGHEPFSMAADAIFHAACAMRERQPLFAATGAIHAAASFGGGGQILKIREDVGRHNALDKLIGATLLADEIPMRQAIMVSGRIGFELVQKAARASCPMLAAVGGPSTLAIETANDLGITLAAFVRGQRLNVYTHPERIY